MSHLDEGHAHAYLDGALDEGEHQAVERHIAECAECAARVAEARGYIAAASNVLSRVFSGKPNAALRLAAIRPAIACD